MFKRLKQKRCNHYFVYIGEGNIHLRATSPDPDVIKATNIICQKCELEKTVRDDYWQYIKEKQKILDEYNTN